MGVDHCRLYVAVAKKLLDGTDVVSSFEEVGGEGMAEGVAGDRLTDAGLQRRLVDSPLEDRRIHVVPAFLASFWILPSPLLWEKPLPGELELGVGVLPVKGPNPRRGPGRGSS